MNTKPSSDNTTLDSAQKTVQANNASLYSDADEKKKFLLQVKNLSFSYTKTSHNIQTNPTSLVLNNINFSLKQGELLVIGGDSGCGKSTLLRLIAGFEKPLEGEIIINNDCYSSPNYVLAPEKRHIGFLFQDHALFPQKTVYQNIEFGIRHFSKEARQEIAYQMLEKIKLTRFAKKYPDELSIGQIQRVALARALAMQPVFLLLDEPFSSLDARTSFELIEEVQDIKNSETAIIMVTHEAVEALYLADHIMLISEGSIQQYGTPEQLYKRPNNHAIASYFDEINFFPITQTICGQLCSPCGFIKTTQIENYQVFEKTKEFHLCVRPQNIRIQTNTKARYQQENWIVQKKYFMGDHYKIILESIHPQFKGLKVIVVQYLNLRCPQMGEIVQLSLFADSFWAISFKNTQ